MHVFFKQMAGWQLHCMFLSSVCYLSFDCITCMCFLKLRFLKFLQEKYVEKLMLILYILRLRFNEGV